MKKLFYIIKENRNSIFSKLIINKQTNFKSFLSSAELEKIARENVKDLQNAILTAELKPGFQQSAGFALRKNQNNMEERVYIKDDHTSHKATLIFILNLLHKLGIGPLSTSALTGNGQIATITKGLRESQNPESERKFFERSFPDQQGKEFFKRKDIIDFATNSLCLGDLSMNTNSGIVEKKGLNGDSKYLVKIFDFDLPEEPSTPINPSLIPAFPDIKLDENGKYLSKSERKKEIKKASFSKVVEISFVEGLKEYFDLKNIQITEAQIQALYKYAFKYNDHRIKPQIFQMDLEMSSLVENLRGKLEGGTFKKIKYLFNNSPVIDVDKFRAIDRNSKDIEELARKLKNLDKKRQNLNERALKLENAEKNRVKKMLPKEVKSEDIEQLFHLLKYKDKVLEPIIKQEKRKQLSSNIRKSQSHIKVNLDNIPNAPVVSNIDCFACFGKRKASVKEKNLNRRILNNRT
jgi:hypothetical protein